MGYLKLTYREQNPTLKVVKGLFFSTEKSCAVHYNYDIHGNVKSLLHDNPELAARNSSLNTQRYKRMDYTYDLISGNVKMVSYQNAWPDAWHHAYEYDADNRIKTVYTSTYPEAAKSEFSPFSYTGSAFWDEDVVYHYYDHGPLARVELGEHTVQGIDYSYLISGWIKGINSESLLASRDMGLDGSQALLPDGSENSNKNFARDAFSFSLGYYNGDYSPINGSATFLADKTGSDLLASTNNLYNGNISSMVTTITTPVTFVPEPTFEILAQSNAYTYDRLNRLRESKSFANLDYDNNLWMNSGNPYDGRYHNQFTCNANGGMLTALAKNALGETIDNQTYHRATTTNGRYINNRTYAITDVATQTSGEDLLDQQAFDNTVLSNNNYDFTEIGERNKNLSEDIESITWTVYGKKAGVKRTATSGKNNVTFNYDPQNNRIAKHVYTSDDVWINSEYYVHDAQGNLMATYRLEASSGSGLSYKLTERHIYGSNNLGIVTTPVEMIGANTPTDTYPHIIGDKRFNGSNHLNNVLSVFTDKKLPLDVDNNGIIDGYLPQVISANDYAPFGSRLTERTFNKELYPNSFNGKREAAELDGEQDYGERDYNPKEREFDKDDPLITSGHLYPWYSPYQFAGNKPIWAIDQDGLEEFFRTDYYNAAGNLYTTEIRMVSNVGASLGMQTVHHSTVAQTIDGAGNSSFNISWTGSTFGTTQGVNAFGSPFNNNVGISTQIRRRSLNLNAAGTPQRYQLPNSITVTTTDRATGTITTSVAVNGELVPITDGGPFNIGFHEALLNANGTIVGFSQRNPNNPRSGFRKFGETELTFNAANTNGFDPNAPASSPTRQNNVPFFNNGASRTTGSNFGIFGPARGGFNGRNRTIRGGGGNRRRRTPGVFRG